MVSSTTSCREGGCISGGERTSHTRPFHSHSAYYTPNHTPTTVRSSIAPSVITSAAGFHATAGVVTGTTRSNSPPPNETLDAEFPALPPTSTTSLVHGSALLYMRSHLRLLGLFPLQPRHLSSHLQQHLHSFPRSLHNHPSFPGRKRKRSRNPLCQPLSQT